MLPFRRYPLYVILIISGLILAACASQPPEQIPETGGEQTQVVETPGVETPVSGTQSVSPGLPPEAVLAAQSWLAGQVGVPVEQVRIVEVEQAEWSDSCLGLGQANESCLQAITPGWRAVFEINGTSYEVRTNETGSEVRMVP